MKFAPFVVLLLVTSLIPFSSSANALEDSRNWTFMVYMDADNTLSDYAADDLAEMMSYGSNLNISIVVLYDSTESGDSAIYYIERGKKVEVASLGEVNMGSGDTLKFFLNWTYHNYPARHYFLDLWDHGSYYGGVCTDHGDWLTLGEIRHALSFFMNLSGKRIDVVGFDACRMGGIEIFYALSGLADYGVASEKDEPASGWPYYDILSKMENSNPEEASHIVVDAMYSWVKRFYQNDGLSVILASVNLSLMPRFLEIFNSDLQDAIPVAYYLQGEIIGNTSSVERYELSTVADFHHLMSLMMNVHDYLLTKLARDTISLLDNMTYYRVWDCPNPANGYHARYAHGVGVYYPLYAVSGDYFRTLFARDTLWDEFLDAVFNPYEERGTGSATLALTGSNLTVSYASSGASVEIYVENLSGGYSGVLPSTGEYTFNLSYGVYTVYVYSYGPGGTVVWRWREKVDHLRKITLVGKFYLNDRIARGARITVSIGNETYTVVQGENGFTLELNYPREIWDNSTIRIRVDYGLFHRTYTYRVGTLKGEDTILLVIKTSEFPSLEALTFGSLAMTLIALALLLYIRRRSEVS